ncbi:MULTISPECIES: DUF58 domain-containing protein [unclassified Leptolyngbya]|uniref:DUF58 domain-containing protein n=1 Tax=unclassified Leptolyngbya TaxID=2650499 RepID=UPI001689CEAA|nr:MULTISPECIES: DUF58 domain-containing protein [unclassified Leptolyngbya]MBD1914178.1 DUF58 domain-containing protein [Leptolyngbya sp. FACHB-8]MBD2157185.1 DUF58 domain-containing protein [Leptolyngbya sp. FACHB-16]
MVPAARLYQLVLLGTALGMAIALYNTDNLLLLQGAIAFTLFFDLILLGLGLVDVRRGRSQRLQITRDVAQKLSIGRHNPVNLHLQTTHTKQPLRVQIRDHFPAQFQASSPLLKLSLPPDTEETVNYTVFPAERGEYPWGDLYIRQLGPWGLAWQEWRVPQSTKVSVYPDLMGLQELSIRLAVQTTGNIRKTRRAGMGTEFTELREYYTGDDPRLIDWKATARRSRLLVRVLEPEQEQTVIVLLDRGRLMTAQVAGISRFNWGLNATLSLALAGLNRGDRVGVGVFDRDMQVWIPPERGQHHLTKLIERLTPLQPALLEPDYLGAITTATTQQHRRALVVMLTDLVDETASGELLLAMQRLTPRYLPFCVVLRDPAVDAIAHTPSTDISETYNRAVALDLMNQRKVALAKLKQRGVLVLDAPANQISEALVERYLQVKARNLL